MIEMHFYFQTFYFGQHFISVYSQLFWGGFPIVLLSNEGASLRFTLDQNNKHRLKSDCSQEILTFIQINQSAICVRGFILKAVNLRFFQLPASKLINHTKENSFSFNLNKRGINRPFGFVCSTISSHEIEILT